jgi:hypothetical protein
MSVATIAKSIPETLKYFCLTYPLQQLYLRSYWHNQSLYDICAALTRTPAEFWASSTETQLQCQHIIYNDFDRWLAIQDYIILNLFLLLSVWCGYRVARWVISKMFC